MNTPLDFLSVALEALVKSGVILGAALGMSRLCRNQSAAVRRLVLSAAVVGILITAAASPVVPRWTAASARWFHAQALPAPPVAGPPPPPVIGAGREALLTASPPASTPTAWRRLHFPPWLIPLIWSTVSGALWLHFAINLRRLHWLRMASEPVTASEVISFVARCGRKVVLLQSDTVAAPVTWGIVRPVILLPTGLLRLSPECRQAVLCHEFAHIRAYDFHMRFLSEVACGLIWFQPLIWIVSRRLREEQESASDNEVLASGGKASQFAKLLLEWDSASGRDSLAAVGMAHRSCLKRRLYALLDPHQCRDAVPRAAVAGASFLTLAAALPLAALRFSYAIPVEPATRPAPWNSPGPPAAIAAPPIQFSQVQQPQPPAGPPKSSPPAKPASSPRPKFDVASVRPCQPGDGPGRGGKGGASTGYNPDLPEGVGGYFRASPGRLDVTCASVLTLVSVAYIEHGTPLLNNPGSPLNAPERVKGVPKWALAARYTIHAESDDPAATGPVRIGDGPGARPGPAQAVLYGSMLQTLLEDRFRLRVHREIAEAAMYALTVAKGGLKLKPMRDGDCVPDAPPEWRAGGKPPCGWVGWDTNGPNRRLLLGGVSLNRLAETLSELILDRYVMDETAITGSFVARLEYAPDDNTRCLGPARFCAVDLNSDIPPGPAIFGALQQQFGLKLESIKGPQERIAIDHVEPPSEN